MEEQDELEAIRARKMGALKGQLQGRGEMKMAEGVTEVKDATFEEFIKKHKVAVIDCWAPWCGPCRAIAPKVEELAKEMEGKVGFGKLNTDENEAIPMKYNITAIPTLLVFKDGKLVDKMIGAGSKEMMKMKFEKQL
ncbi:MAG: thioredoxin [Methanomassiliicoccales archaeon]